MTAETVAMTRRILERPPATDPDFAEAKAICGGRGNWITAANLARDLRYTREAVESVRNGTSKSPESTPLLLQALMLARGAEIVSGREVYLQLIEETERLLAERQPLPPDPELDFDEPEKMGSIYVIECGEFIKIGFSANPESRIVQIQTSTPLRIVVLHIRPGSTRHERDLHVRFAALRHSGEWFRKEGDLAAWIEAGCPA